MSDKLICMIQNSVDGCSSYWAELIADHLIAHGVTVQEWIPVSERLPEETGEYNVMIEGGEKATSLWYSQFRNGWYNFDDDYYREPYDDVTHWMPLPEAPKEVE